MSSSAYLQVLDEPQALERLVGQVQQRGLHVGSAFSDPMQWLIDWLSRPADYLSGQCPADFLTGEDGELIVLSLLMQHRPVAGAGGQAAAAPWLR